MVVVHLSSPYGSTSGTSTGPSGPSGQSTAVTKFSVWATSDYICAMRLHWGTTMVTYGNTANGDKYTITLFSSFGEWVCGIYVDVDPQGILRGISFDSNFAGGILSAGYIGDGYTTVFVNSTYKWTDMIAYTGTLQSLPVIWGAKFYYTTPTFSPMSDLVLPALGLLAHVAVVGKSYSKVDELRSQLSIAAPSCDPPQGTDPQKAQLWYRTYQAQETCKGALLVYVPSIMIASVFGSEAFGEWATRAVGALSLLGAYFRYQYLNSYIENADKRLAPYYCASFAMKPIFYMAVVSCGYVVGKQAFGHISEKFNLKRTIAVKRTNQEDDESNCDSN